MIDYKLALAAFIAAFIAVSFDDNALDRLCNDPHITCAEITND